MGHLIDRSPEASLIRTTLIAVLIAVSFAGRVLSPALATPQMMGLVANKNAVLLQCQHGDYFAEFASKSGVDIGFHTIPGANHNFYSEAWKQEITGELLEFVAAVSAQTQSGIDGT